MQKKLVFAVLLALVAVNKRSHGTVVFSEDFGTLANATAITTSNTDFNYVRSGTGGSITATNPSSFSGASMNLGGSTGGSLTGVGLTSGTLSSLNVLTLSLNFRTGNSSFGDLLILGGTGNTTFTTNNAFSNAELMFGVQFNNGVLEYRTSDAWTATSFTVAANTNYSLDIIANSSGSNLTYALGTLAADKVDIAINGTVISNDVNLANNAILTSGFRIYQINGAQRYEIDNVSLSDTVAAVPEASAFLYGGLIVTGLVGWKWRQKRRVEQVLV